MEWTCACGRRYEIREVGGVSDRAIVPYSWGNRPGDTFYHAHDRTNSVGDYADLAGTLSRVSAWVSTSTRFAESLTSPAFVKATAGDAVLLTATFAGLAGLTAAAFQLPWQVVPIVGVAGFAASAGVLVIHKRAMLHTLIRGQVEKDKRRRQELRVQIDRPDNHGLEFLYLNSNVTLAQLTEFAHVALEGGSLSVHKWTGQGALFTRGQFDDLMTELEKLSYVSPARGNVSRALSNKGRALMRALAEK